MIIGHQGQIEKLRSLINKKDIPHAFLFTGPEGVGKRTVAKWFFKALNCLNSNPPCDECVSCNEINDGISYDMLEVAPLKKTIEIAQIDLVKERVSYRPLKANYKGIIIDSAHLMKTYTQDALLVTLEEPTKNTVIFLVTEYPQLLANTIISRCFEIKFSSVPQKDIIKVVKDKEIVELAMGRPGRAVSFSSNKSEMIRVKSIKKQAEDVVKGDFVYQSSALKKIVKDEEERNVTDFLNHLLSTKRALVLQKLKKNEDVTRDVESIKKTEEVILLAAKTNTNLQLAVERALIINEV